MSYLGSLYVYSDGTVTFDGRPNPRLSLNEIELIYRAMTGAEAAMNGRSESVVRLAARVLAIAGAEKARAKRITAEQTGLEAVG